MFDFLDMVSVKLCTAALVINLLAVISAAQILQTLGYVATLSTIAWNAYKFYNEYKSKRNGTDNNQG